MDADEELNQAFGYKPAMDVTGKGWAYDLLRKGLADQKQKGDKELNDAFGFKGPSSEPTSTPNAQFKNDSVAKEYEGVKPPLRNFAETIPDQEVITSGQRSPGVNAAVGGKPNSYHLSGEALDFRSLSPQDIKHAQESGLKVINEGDHYHVQPQFRGQFDQAQAPQNPALDKEINDAFGYKPPNQGPEEIGNPIDAETQGIQKPSMRQMVKRGLEEAAPRLNKMLGLDQPQQGKGWEFARNLNKGLVDAVVGFPAHVGAGIVGLPEELGYAKEHPGEYAKEVAKQTGSMLATPFNPFEYNIERWYEDPVGRIMNLGQALGFGKGVYDAGRRGYAAIRPTEQAPIEAPPLRTPAEENLAERVAIRKEGEALKDVMAGRNPEQAIPLYPPPGENIAGLLPERAGPDATLLPSERMPAGASPPTENTPLPQYPIIKGTPEDAFAAEMINRLTPPETVPPKVIKGTPEQKFQIAPPEGAPAEVGEIRPGKVIKPTFQQNFENEMIRRLSEPESKIPPEGKVLKAQVSPFQIWKDEVPVEGKPVEDFFTQPTRQKTGFDLNDPWAYGLTKGQKMGLENLREEIRSSQARKAVPGEEGVKNIGSSFPIQDLGSKESQVKIIDKALSGQELTPPQKEVFGKMLDYVGKRTSEMEDQFHDLRSAKMTDLIKEILNKQSPGAVGYDIGKVVDLTNERNVRANAAQQEVFRRVKEKAAEWGVTIDQALDRMKIDPKVFAQFQQNAQEKQDFQVSPPKLRVASARPSEPEPLIAGTGLKTEKFVEGPSYRPDKINAPDDVEKLLGNVSRETHEFSSQRLSKPDDAVRNLADLTGVKVDDLMKAKPGSIANAETVYKSREIVLSLAEDLQKSLNQIDTATATPEQLQMIRDKYLRLQGTAKAVAGFRTEASNIFRQFKMKVKPNEDVILREMAGDLKRLGVETGGDLAAFTKGARELAEPTWADKAWHLWYSSILSGPSTHLKNFLGNFTQMGMELFRTVTTQPQETVAAFKGLFRGFGKGAGEAREIWKHGEPSKFEERGLLPIEFKGKASFLNYADYVGRALSAADAFFRRGAQGMEAGGLARSQKIPFEEAMQHPEVKTFGERLTYVQKPAGVMGALSDVAGAFTRKIGLGKLVVPFTRIIANVVNNALDWTPVGFYRAAIPEGIGGRLAKGSQHGPTPFEIKTPRQRYQQIGRAAIGTLAMGKFAGMASENRLSGNGPSDYRKRQQLQATGWKPNSIKIGNKWYPYSQWGPLALPMALVGNYFDASRFGDMRHDEILKKATAGILGSVNTVMDMSFLRGVSDLFGAIGDWDRKGPGFLKNFTAQQVTSVVPNLVKQTARYFDPTVYDTEGIWEKIKSATRFTSGLKPALDVWGEPIQGERLTQLEPGTETSDPVKKYLADHQLFVSVPQKNTKIKDENTHEDREMTRDEYYNFIKLSGPRIHERIERNFDRFKGEDPEDQKTILEHIVSDERKRVKAEMQRGSYQITR